MARPYGTGSLSLKIRGKSFLLVICGIALRNSSTDTESNPPNNANMVMNENFPVRVKKRSGWNYISKLAARSAFISISIAKISRSRSVIVVLIFKQQQVSGELRIEN